MKKKLLIITLSFLLYLNLLTACATQNTPSDATPFTNNNTVDQSGDGNTNTPATDVSMQPSAHQTPDFIKEIENLSDEDLLYRYINGLEVALIRDNELLFNDPDEIPSEALYMFFLYTLNNYTLSEYSEHQKQYREYEKQWYNETDKLFHIPTKDITDRLDGYFEHYSLDISEVYGYNSEEDAVIERTISGFGGDVWTKVNNRSMDNDILTLVVDFYEDGSFQKIIETKKYMVRLYDKGYYLLAITKE